MRVGTVMGVALLLGLAPTAAGAQEGAVEDVREARIWLDRGDEPVVQRGDRVRIYYRTSHDSYVSVFHIDTDGFVRLVHPSAPEEDHYVAGGRDYRLLFPRSPYWVVDEDPGMGYYFLVASPEPFDFSDFEYARTARGWDLSRVGRAVYADPYLAMDDYVAALLPDWEYIPYTLDFISYNVGGTHEYPRFMCYDCHGFRSYAQWNPYDYACSDFRVVIWDDPYYYPVYRYSGTRVVYATPLRGRPRFGFTTRVAGQPWAPVFRRREAPPGRTVQFKEPGAARGSLAPPVQRRATPSDLLRPQTPGGTGRTAVARPQTAPRRAPAAAPGGTSQGGVTRPGGASTGGRPVLQRRPAGATAPTRSAPSSRATPSRSGVTRPSGGNRAARSTSPSVSPRTSRGTAAPQRTVRPPQARPTPTRRAPTVTRPPSTQSRPTVQPPQRTPATRSTPAARPQVRPPTPRPTVRPRSGGSSGSKTRPPVRRRGGGGGD